MEPREVGGELLDILSRGLYSDARDAVREYVQNGIDAGAAEVIITTEGPGVTIRDDGSGMDREALRKARRLGLSEKSATKMVGYRGIGIYASFGMCERLSLTTRQAGAPDIQTLTFDFGSMRKILEADRTRTERAGVALAELLYEHTSFGSENYAGDAPDHFTVVRLQGLAPQYRAQLANTSSLKSYLLNTVPIAFPDRGYGEKVNKWLAKHAKFNAIRVVLRGEGEPETNVEPALAEGVRPPEYEWLTDESGKKTAFVWHALSDSGDRIQGPAATDERSGVSGFLLRIKGFTLGDRTTAKQLWPPRGGRTLYHHYTGEIHILEGAGVYPNASRNNLEASRERQAFEKALADCFSQREARADIAREILKVWRQPPVVERQLADLEAESKDPDTNQFELYRKSKNMLESIEHTAAEVQRLSRGKRGFKLASAQNRELTTLHHKLSGLERKAKSLTGAASRRTKSSSSSSSQASEASPQVARIARALAAVREMQDQDESGEVAAAIPSLEAALEAQLVGRAVAALDGLKAAGVQLGEEAENSRRELRLVMGWSPFAPVTLREAIENAGISIATEREEWFIHGIDAGLLLAAAGRGEQYEALIESVAEALSSEAGLQ